MQQFRETSLRHHFLRFLEQEVACVEKELEKLEHYPSQRIELGGLLDGLRRAQSLFLKAQQISDYTKTNPNKFIK